MIRGILMRRALLSAALASILLVTIAPTPVYSDVPTACDTCSDGSGGGTEDAGGHSNVPFATFTPSGTETDSNLEAACDSTFIDISWDAGFPGETASFTYVFQITDNLGNLAYQETGPMNDVTFPNGYYSVAAKVPIPVGGGVSLNVYVDGSLYHSSAGANFSGVQTPKC